MVVEITKSPNGDTRSAQGNVSFPEFAKSNDMHREDVKNMMNELARMMQEAGEHHDWTKKEKEKEFYDQFTKSKQTGENFTNSDWYQYHITTERHHINNHCPDDINLIDILEMISDCYCAGMARTGKVYPIELSDDILQKAFKNTCELVGKSIKVNNN